MGKLFKIVRLKKFKFLKVDEISIMEISNCFDLAVEVGKMPNGDPFGISVKCFKGLNTFKNI